MSNNLLIGKTSTGSTRPVQVTEAGAVVISGGTGGGGGGGDASAANQLAEIARLEAIRDRLPSSGTASAANQVTANTTLNNIDLDIGRTDDSVATSDTGTFSIVSLIKRGLQRLTGISSDTTSLNAKVGQTIATAGFSASGSSVIDPFFVQTPVVGTGMGYNQSSGSLNITCGTTTNAEFLARSVQTFKGSMRMRYSVLSSGRVSNNNFVVMLADLIGEGLAVTVNSATSITVAIPGHTFDSTNIGQSIQVGGIVGISGAVPGRYAIASVVAGTSITLTVSGWPASGTGTATLFGRNCVRYFFAGGTPTQVAFDVQRNGWAAGDTNATINTTLTPGTVIQTQLTGREVFMADSLRATSTAPNFTTRASRFENIVDPNVDLYAFVWAFNGTTAPGQNITWTMGHLSIEGFTNLPVFLEGSRSVGQANALPVVLQTGANAIGSIAAGTVDIGGVWTQYRQNNASGAATPVAIMAPATPTPTVVRSSNGRLIGGILTNSAAALRSVKFWNTAAGSVTMGTTAALFEIDIPAGQTIVFSQEAGVAFATAVTIAITGAKGLTDNTAITANDVTGAFFHA